MGDGAHADHEHVIVERMPERAALLALLLAAPAGAGGLSSPRTVRGSVTRLAGPELSAADLEPRPRSRWATGDFVVAEMLDEAPYRVETPSGEYEAIGRGDRLVGALGARAATLQAVGDWRDVADDLILDSLTAAGVLGRCTSASIPPPPMASLRYLGHATVDGEAATMRGRSSRRPPASSRRPS